MKNLHIENITVKELKLVHESIQFRTRLFLSFVYIVKGEGELSYEDHKINFAKGKLIIIPQHQVYHFRSADAQLIAIQCPVGVYRQNTSRS